jgi:transcriptional regulator of acetoin/glycerol metabolism
VLVLQNVSALSAHDQATIGRWLDTHRTQLISTNPQPLFPLIALGLFDEALYYRLNVMLLGVGLAPPSRLEEEADMSSLR